MVHSGRIRTRRIDQLYRLWRSGSPIEAEELLLDPSRFEAYVGGQTLALTPHEFAILFYIALVGRPVTRQELAKQIWDEPPRTKAVAAHVTRIRRKLEQANARREYVRGVWGQGYVFEAKSRGEADS